MSGPHKQSFAKYYISKSKQPIMYHRLHVKDTASKVMGNAIIAITMLIWQMAYFHILMQCKIPVLPIVIVIYNQTILGKREPTIPMDSICSNALEQRPSTSDAL